MVCWRLVTTIFFLHTEPVQEVARTYSRVFNCLAFLRSDATTKKLAWLAKRKHTNSILWMLAEPTLPSKRWSFIQILAIGATEAVVAIKTRASEYIELRRALPLCLQDIQKEAEDKGEIPRLTSTEDITSCGCRVSSFQEGIIKGDGGGWKVANREELPASFIAVKASANQMLWLSQYPSFSPVLRALQERFGPAEIEIPHVLALDAAVNIGTFRQTLYGWLKGVDIFIYEFEHMLVEGVETRYPCQQSMQT
ncbi:hypothetical protein N656DRAFT_641065 [Canariomyces notabilis]|uniref:Uncharacterized protein n=1 Tax=Canariomyces notabilis TaxID=2074819 RepID=A0AAN6TEV8_9PEZI|nr:hypothetical protein N656DRAFT_641065 [Canariomyces arenarius]